MLVKDHLKIILANGPNNFELAEPTTCCGHMKDKESRDKEPRDKDGTPRSLRGTVVFEVKGAARVTENWWD